MTRARVLLGLSVALLVSACTKRPGPDEILRQYTDATLHGRVEEAWPLLSAKDRAYKPLPELKKAAEQLESANAKAIVAKTRFETAKVEIHGDEATVTERLTGPDVKRIVAQAEANPENTEKVKTLPPEKAMEFGQQLLAQALAAPDCPLTSTDQTIHLVRENGDWKVVAGFEEHERQEQAKDPVLRDLQGQPPE